MGEMHWVGKRLSYLFVIFIYSSLLQGNGRWRLVEQGGGWNRFTAGYAASHGEQDPTGEGIHSLSGALPLYKPNDGESH